jgi:transcriptional regulator with XRE-family HTH domain
MANRLSQLFTESHLDLRTLAAKLNDYATKVGSDATFTQGTLTNYQTGERAPDAIRLCALADYFNVSSDWILGRRDIRMYSKGLIGDKAFEEEISSLQVLVTLREMVRYGDSYTRGGIEWFCLSPVPALKIFNNIGHFANVANMPNSPERNYFRYSFFDACAKLIDEIETNVKRRAKAEARKINPNVPDKAKSKPKKPSTQKTKKKESKK